MKSPTPQKKPRSEQIAPPLVSSTPEVVMSEMIETLVRERAYQLYLERGGEDGDAESDWYAAEAEVLRRLDAAAA